MTSVKFTLCTFNDMTRLGTGGYDGGSAIYLKHAQSSLTITQCFFHVCRSMGENDNGGAVCVWDSASDCHISLSSSSFVECATMGLGGAFGGSVYCSSYSTVTVSDCFFEKSKSQNYDAALSLSNPSLVTLSNCAFVACYSAIRAGAMALNSVKSIDLSFLQFRGCSSQDSKTNDVWFGSMHTTIISEDTVRFCDSTSDRPNVYQSRGDSWVDVSHLVPELESTPTATVEVSISEGTATVTATASEEVKGTMGILLKGSNVPRLVHVQFGSNSHTSKFGSTAVSSDDDGVLPPADYEVYASSMPSNYLSSLQIIAAECSLKDVNTTRIILRGMNLGSGSYSMLIRNGANTPFNISLTRSNLTTLVGEAPLHPLTVEGRLDWGTEYPCSKKEQISKKGQILALQCAFL
ncbi:hypothetical protein BLNAU_15356 [Blattamonas nauphoetae]|uniref:Uncharacterized protein n=1 Tax=Blattamonas nauphoetae TaxID=2049346 RepID=A0ABQ9XE76_9EUKA|nr:hypothetical protein BLNAU_15356 [Blattamonas nauphoetae]